MIAVQSVPASFGAMLVRKQLSTGDSRNDEDQAARAGAMAANYF
jgi:hypothetical protein